MLNILKLAAVAGAVSEVRRRTAYAMQIALRSVFAGLMLFAGGAFLTAAGWLKLSEIYGAIIANLTVGGALVTLAIIVYIVGVIVPEHYKQRYAAPAQKTMGVGAAAGATSGLDLSSLATLAALGVAAGRMFKR